eukprot:1144003-Ditylum_brightwellii.AAC.1
MVDWIHPDGKVGAGTKNYVWFICWLAGWYLPMLSTTYSSGDNLFWFVLGQSSLLSASGANRLFLRISCVDGLLGVDYFIFYPSPKYFPPMGYRGSYWHIW